MSKITKKAILESIEGYTTYRAFFTYIKCKCPVCSQREQPYIRNPFLPSFYEHIEKSPVPIFYKFGSSYTERENILEMHQDALDKGWKTVKNEKGLVIWIAPNH